MPAHVTELGLPAHNDFRARQHAEKIPYVLPVEKWPELRREIERGPSRYKSTIEYFQDMGKRFPVFIDLVYHRSAA